MTLLTDLKERALTVLGLQVRVDDSPGWVVVQRSGGGPSDRPWWDYYQDYTDALEAWRKNFLIRQIVRLTTAYVVGDGFSISSNHPWASSFVDDFINDPQNKLVERLAPWCDELTRAGELYIALFPNRVSGMQYVRAIPAGSIQVIETDPDDYEKELRYMERVDGQLELKPWLSPLLAGPNSPVLLHYPINKAVGATRGEGDLTPVLPWAQRYTEWLKERVRFNRLRNDLAAVQVRVKDDGLVEKKAKQYAAAPPTGGAVVVTGPSEELVFPSANIQGYDAAPDGHAIRLAVAAGANIPLHFLAEGSSATRSTAEEMGDPTHRHYRMRQQAFKQIITDVVKQAYFRRCATLGQRPPADPKILVEAPDVSRADNQSLASAASSIVSALAVMRENGWVDDETAAEMAYKFAGEVKSRDEIQEILANGLKERNQREREQQREQQREREKNPLPNPVDPVGDEPPAA